jgi:hypothetical protein
MSLSLCSVCAGHSPAPSLGAQETIMCAMTVDDVREATAFSTSFTHWWGSARGRAGRGGGADTGRALQRDSPVDDFGHLCLDHSLPRPQPVPA